VKLFYKEDYFDEFNGKYESISDEEFELLRKYLPKINKKARILDLGCGSGALGEHVKNFQSESSVFGLDISLPLLRKCSISCCQSDASCLPFKDESLDVIIAAAAYHHFPDFNKAISEPFRCLRPGGYFFAYEPNKFHPHRFLLMTNPLRHIFYRTGDHAISPQSFANKLKRIGFINLQIHYVALANEKSSWFARFNKHVYDTVANSRLDGVSCLLAPWFIVTGIKSAHHLTPSKPRW